MAQKYLLNITMQVHKNIHADWLAWVKNEHIPTMMNTQYFTHYNMWKLLDALEEDTLSYAIQFVVTKDDSEIMHYIEDYRQSISKQVFYSFNNACFAFSTLLLSVDL